MSEISEAFLSKAQECLEGAKSELANHRFNNCANRSYYACFQAAIAALDLAGIRPSQGRAEWSHAFVQSQFTGQLVNRRKLYPPELRDMLSEALRVREQADYGRTPVSERQATRSMLRARTFLDAVMARGGANVL